MFWICPKCGKIVDFTRQLRCLFDETGDAEFEPESGVIFHTIFCDNCNSIWTMSISEREEL